MASQKERSPPEKTTPTPLRASSSKVTKPTNKQNATSVVRRSARLVNKPSVTVQHYRNGLLNLERTPSHLVHIAKSNSIDSPLLRLPLELRTKIWNYAMGYQYIKAPGSQAPTARFSYEITKHGGAMIRPKHRVVNWTRIKVDIDLSPRTTTTSEPSAFHLPEVCRQIYSETTTLGYSLNVFAVSYNLNYYSNWATGLLAAYRKAITHIEPDYLYLLDLVTELERRPMFKALPHITHIFVSEIAISYLLHISARRHSRLPMTPANTRDEWEAWITGQIKAGQGDHIEVVFESPQKNVA